ncbi:MAG: hypothetical protein NT030_05380, partial [Candidatus Saganbacteria bacterium]|nr:hypothetical protein [Candidatus Saganbacteria bacterium]
MKKILIAMVLVVAMCSACYAAGPRWGIGAINIVASTYTLDISPTLMPMGSIFFNVADNMSIELGAGAASNDTGDSLTTIMGRFLFNVIKADRANAHLGIQAVNSSISDGPSFTDLGLIFGGEAFLTDNFSVLVDLIAQSLNV